MFTWRLRRKARKEASRLFDTAPHKGGIEWETQRHVCLRFLETSQLGHEKYQNWPPKKLAIITCLHALDIRMRQTSIRGEPQRKLTGVGAKEAFDLYFHILEEAKVHRFWSDKDLDDMDFIGRTGIDPDQRTASR
jgi:hypothetical protein